MTGLTSPPYTDEDARVAVDGSEVAVEQANQANVADVATNAEDADNLGGQPPSTFETPNSTQTSFASGGWVSENTTISMDNEDRYSYFRDISINAVCDSVEVSWSGTGDAKLGVLKIDGTQIASEAYERDGSKTINFDAKDVNNLSAEVVYGNNAFGSFDFTLERYHQPSAGPHAHNV